MHTDAILAKRPQRRRAKEKRMLSQANAIFTIPRVLAGG